MFQFVLQLHDILHEKESGVRRLMRVMGLRCAAAAAGPRDQTRVPSRNARAHRVAPKLSALPIKSVPDPAWLCMRLCARADLGAALDALDAGTRRFGCPGSPSRVCFRSWRPPFLWASPTPSASSS